MTPEERAALLARTRRRGISRAELEAAASILGAGSNRARMLRRAHAGVYRMRKAGEPVPFWLRVLESEYKAARRKPRETPRRVVAWHQGSPAVAAAIREARERAGLSQRRLADLAGVTRRSVQYWEEAKRRPGEQSWVQLELTLGPLGVVRESKDAPREEAADAAA